MEQNIHPAANALGFVGSIALFIQSRITVDDFEKHLAWSVGLALTLMLIVINWPAFKKRVQEIFVWKKKDKKKHK